MSHGTFRNKISRLLKEGKVEVSCLSHIAFYSLEGVKFGRAERSAVTGDHTGVACSSSSPSSNPLYRLLRDLPLGRNSIHDIHLSFASPQIYVITTSAISSNTLGYRYGVLPRSKDIILPGWLIGDLLIGVTIHRTDTVSVTIGCSLNPVALDINGLIRLTNALSVVEERLSRIGQGSRAASGCGVIEDADASSHDLHRRIRTIPAHSQWTVTMWHFGADALVEYSGEKFCVTWQTAENELVRAYSKVMKGRGTRIRLERQEYPRATLADIIEQKLSRVSDFDI